MWWSSKSGKFVAASKSGVKIGFGASHGGGLMSFACGTGGGDVDICGDGGLRVRVYF